MPGFWETDLTEEETEKLLDKAAREVIQRKLETPAILVLEMHKPVCGVLAQSAIAMSPFLVPFVGFDFLDKYSNLLNKKENVERLIRLLDDHRTGTPDQVEK